MTLRAAENELVHVAGSGTIVAVKPIWAKNSPDATSGRRFLLLGDDICLVLEPHRKDMMVVTVLFKGGLSPEARQRRNDRAAHQRRRKHAKRRKR